MKKIITIASISILFGGFQAQQTQLSSLYQMNRVMINPAEVGLNNSTDFSLGYREQWAKYVGAPSTAWMTGQTKLNDKMGLGAVVIYDEMAFIKNIDARVQYAYQIKLDKTSFLRFGISAGMIQTGINFSDIKADDYTDGILSNPTFSGSVFDMQFGGLYNKGNFNVGFSVPQLLSPSKQLPTQQIIGQYDYVTHFNIYADYHFISADENMEFIPMFLLRRTNAAYQFDIFGNVKIDKKYFFGMGVRQQGGLILNAGIQAFKPLQIHYAYEISRNGAASRTGGTHEFFLKFSFEKKVKNLTEEDGTPRKAVEKF
jgi:type IX secretion system PorP/SprF family membrane protein